MIHYRVICVFFFFNDTATTEIYTLSLHDALPICAAQRAREVAAVRATAQPDGVARANGTVPPGQRGRQVPRAARGDRKSTRLNSSHSQISYAVFCLKKKKRITQHLETD